MELMENNKIKGAMKIGTHYKKDNIILGTVVVNEEELLNELKENYSEQLAGLPDEMIKVLVDEGMIQKEHFDIFYQDENGYTYFYDEMPITIKGDDSDGNGTIDKIISVWDYYNEDELFEYVIADVPMIVATTQEPLMQYNDDYNINGKKDRKK